jgi:hypothetical protein
MFPLNLSLNVEALTKQNGVRLLGKFLKKEEIGNPHIFWAL